MEFLIVLIAVFLFLVVPLWALARTFSLKRKSATKDEHAAVVGRLYSLEKKVEELQKELQAAHPTAPEAKPEPAPAPGERARIGVEPPPPIAEQPPEKPLVVPPPPPPPVPPARKGLLPPTPVPPQAPLPPPITEIPPPKPASATLSTKPDAEGAPAVAPARKWWDIEERLGTNWLGKLGIGVLVLGVAFFLAWQMLELGPRGKVVVGWTTGLVLLGLGIYFERSEVYRNLARAGVAGGWAVLFFTAYAMYHVPAARVLNSPLQCLGVMLAVAVPMVVHTLRYRSQVVTGLAFLLAFATLALNRADVYSLIAGAILAAGLAVITLRMHWYELEVFGILAIYLNHFYWLWLIIEPMNVRHEFPGFRANIAILLLYWLIFRTTYILRKTDGEERVSTIAGLLNPLLLLAVLKYQSVYPEMAFWCLLTLGAAELGLGQLPITRRRRTAFVVLTALGAALLFAAFPFRYSAQNVVLIWLAEAEVLFIVGIVLREATFRRLGLLATVPIFINLIAVHGARTFGERMDGARVEFHFALGLVFGLGALLWYANAYWVSLRWPEAFKARLEMTGRRVISYLAGIVVLFGAWVAFPKEWTAMGWMAIVAIAIPLARWLELADVTRQANLLAAVAVLRVLIINLPSAAPLEIGGKALTARLLTVALVAACLYLVSRGTSTKLADLTRYAPPAFLWAGSTLVSLLMWYELRSASVALAWALLGVMLFEIGIRKESKHLRAQAYVALTCAFLRVFFVNFNAAEVPGALDPRVYTAAPLALAFFYVYGRLRELAPKP